MLLSTTQGRVCVYKSVENATPVSVLFFFFKFLSCMYKNYTATWSFAPNEFKTNCPLSGQAWYNDGCSLQPGNMEKREPNIHETISWMRQEGTLSENQGPTSFYIVKCIWAFKIKKSHSSKFHVTFPSVIDMLLKKSNQTSMPQLGGTTYVCSSSVVL